MAQSYLDRYLAGEREQVWSELLALGSAIRQEPLYSDAYAVARETMRRARHNVAILMERLQQLDYWFACSWDEWEAGPPWKPPTEQTLTKLAAVENRYGPLPLSVRAWFEEVGQVDLEGFHPKLSTFDGGPGAKKAPYLISDPLYIRFDTYITPIEKCILRDFEEAGMLEGLVPPGARYRMQITRDMCQKANMSGAGAGSIYIPNPAMDMRCDLLGFEAEYFVSYLRRSFQYGGFANLDLAHPEMANYLESAQEELAFLTKDFLPL